MNVASNQSPLSRLRAAHVAITIGLSLTVGSISLLGVVIPLWLQAVLLVGIVAAVGVPHGGLDHRFGQMLLQDRCGRWWPLGFFLGYGIVAGCVLIAWWAAPWVTALGFVFVAALHFGIEELEPGLLPAYLQGSWITWPIALLTGSLMSGLQALCSPAPLAELLTVVIPHSHLGVSGQQVFALGLLWACVALPALALLIGFYLRRGLASLVSQGSRVSRADQRRCLLEAGRLASLCFVLAVTEPLVGFLVYFCGWHSIRGWLELLEQTAPNNPARGVRSLIAATAPLTVATIVLAGLGSLAWSQQLSSPQVGIRTVFLVLSAIAVPHLLLHVLVHGRDVRLPAWNEKGAVS